MGTVLIILISSFLRTAGYVTSNFKCRRHFEDFCGRNFGWFYFFLTLKCAHLCFCADCQNEVTQVPETLWEQRGKSVEMNCSYSNVSGNYELYWYKLRQEVSVRLYAVTGYTHFSNSKYLTKFDGASGSLIVHNVQHSDSGTYFCSVAPHSVAECQHGITKGCSPQQSSKPQQQTFPVNAIGCRALFIINVCFNQ